MVIYEKTYLRDLPTIYEDELTSLVLRYQKGEVVLKDKIIVGTVYLVYSVIKRLNVPAKEFEDYVQVGTIGLMEALEKYDNNRGTEFSTFAFVKIRGAILNYVRKNHLLQGIGRRKEFAKRLELFISKFLEINRRVPNAEEVSKELHIRKSAAKELLENYQNYVDFQMYPLDNEEADKLGILDTLRDYQYNPEEYIDRIIIKDALKNLTNLEKKVIFYKFYLDLKQYEIAHIINCCDHTISRNKKSAIKKLKNNIKYPY